MYRITFLSLCIVAIIFFGEITCSPDIFSISFYGHVLDKTSNRPLNNIAVKRFKAIPKDMFSDQQYDSIETVLTDSMGYFAFRFVINQSETYKICAFKIKDNWTILSCGGTSNCQCYEFSYGTAENDANKEWTFYLDTNSSY
jgi:hypothetical protein